MRKRLARRMTPQAICEAMCDHCLAPDTQVPFLNFMRALDLAGQECNTWTHLS